MKHFLLFLAPLLLFSVSVFASDTITLENGTVYTGIVLSMTGGQFLVKVDGQEDPKWLSVTEVKKVEFGQKPAAPAPEPIPNRPDGS